MNSSKTKKILLTVIGIILLLGFLGGLTYAWFNTTISGSGATGTVTTGTLSLTFANTNTLDIDNVLPGWQGNKTFTVTNTGTVTNSYNIYWNNVTNTFANKSDFVYEVVSLDGGANLSETIVPSTIASSLIISNIGIEPNETHTYTVKLRFKESASNQNTNQGASFIGTVNIQDNGHITTSTITGTNALTLNNTLGSTLTNYRIYGNTNQATTPTPTNPVDVLSLGDNYVPSAYKQVEYLESSGTQYINTGYTYSNGYPKAIIDFQMINQSTRQQALFGTRPGSTNRFTVFTGISASSLQVDYYVQGSLSNEGTYYTDPNLNLNERNTIELSNQLIINGNTILSTEAQQITSSYPLYLFANNNIGLVQLIPSAKIYNFKLYNNNVLVRNMVPVVRISDGKPGMYDKVNGVFYVNAGTGEFTYGNEVYSFDVNVTGKNLFDKSNATTINGYFDGSNTSIVMGSNIIYYIPCKPNTTYTVSIPQTPSVYTGFGYTNTLPASGVQVYVDSVYSQNGRTTWSVFTGPNAKYLVYRTQETTPSFVENMQIEEGASATAYEPYFAPVDTTITLDEPLRCIVDNCDYIDYSSGKVIRNIGSMTYDGTENWVRYSSTYNYLFYIEGLNPAGKNGSYYPAINTHFPYDSGAFLTPVYGQRLMDNGRNNPSHRYYISHKDKTTALAFATWLGEQNSLNQPVKLYYQYFSPTITEILLPSVPTTGATTYVTVTDGIMSPSSTELSYQKVQ